MRKTKIIASALLLFVSVIMTPQTAIYSKAQQGDSLHLRYDPDDYELSYDEGTYNEALNISITSSERISNVGDAENNCVKAILVKGDDIKTGEQLLDFIFACADQADADYVEAMDSFEPGADKSGLKKYVYMYIKQMLKEDSGNKFDIDDEDVEWYIENYDDEGMFDYEKMNSKQIQLLQAMFHKDLTTVIMEQYLYINGPIVQDNYLDCAYRDWGHGPDINVGAKRVTFHLEQFDEPTDYYLFVLNEKPIIDSYKGGYYPMDDDKYSVYHYVIKGKTQAPTANVASNSGEDEEAYTQDQSVGLTTTSRDQKTYYTLDKSNPKTSVTRKLYDGNDVLITGIPGDKVAKVLKVYTEGTEDYAPSDISEYTYVIDRPKQKAKKPVASVDSGDYTEDLNVELTPQMGDYEAIKTYYTLDGTDPTTSDTSIAYNGGAIAVRGVPGEETTRVLKAYSVGDNNYSAGDVATYTYKITKEKGSAKAPTPDTLPGTYDKDIEVKLICDEGEYETIKTYYTIDGSDPVTSKTAVLYDGKAIPLAGIPGEKITKVIKVYSTGENYYYASDVQTFTYILDEDKVPADKPTASLPEGAYNDDQKVKLQIPENNFEKLTAYYTLDGTNPKTSATRIKYDGKDIELNGVAGEQKKYVLKACCEGKNCYYVGDISEYTYYILKDKNPPKAPTVSVEAGTYENDIEVLISNAEDDTASVNLYYTLDGTDPTVSNTRKKYKGKAIAISGEACKKTSVVLKVCTVRKDDDAVSNVLEYAYTIDKTNLKRIKMKLKTEKGKSAVSFDVIVSKQVKYNGKTHVVKGTKARNGESADIYAMIDGSVTDYAVPVFKAYNSKKITKNNAYIILKFNPNKKATGKQKKTIKKLNKLLKKKKITFKIVSAK